MVSHDAALPISTQGTTVVTWTYDDGNGNTSTQTQNVVITPINDGVTAIDAVTLSADASGYNYQWIDCDNSNEPIIGATDQVFTPTIAGNYACIVDNGTCSVITNCVASSVGIDETQSDLDWTLYPNPTEGNLNINLGKIYSKIDVSVYDMFGKKIAVKEVYNNSLLEIEILGASGMYTVEIKTTDGDIARVKVMKN